MGVIFLHGLLARNRLSDERDKREVIPQIFFQIFFSLTQFQLPNGLAFSLYQQVQIIFL
jgi:hypothetical protein